MKKIIFFISLCILNFLVYSQDIKTPIPAIKSLVNFQNIRDFTLASNGMEAYVTVQSPLTEVSVLIQLKNVNNKWSAPKLMPFSGQYNDLEPFLSKNDLRLYFVSNRPLTDSTKQSKDYDIWYVKRENITSEWGTPINIGLPINTTNDEFYPTLAENNNLYFTSNNSDSKGKDDIYCSVWKNNQYSEPISLSDSINTSGYEFNSYIAINESFIMFSAYNRKDGLGSGDLYISFRGENNEWSKAMNMGKNINSKHMDYCPYYDPNTMTLYFTSKRSSIEKQNNFQSITDVINEINKVENGLSKIYKVRLDTTLFHNK